MAALDHAFAVDQNPVTLEPCDVLAVFRQARVDLLEIGFGRRRHERQAVGAQALDGAVDVLGAAGDVLDALAAVDAEILLDLAGIAGILVDRNPDLAVGAGQRPREQARRAALDIEKPDLPEVEQFLIETGPDVHAAAMDVVGEVIEIEQPGALGARVLCAEPVEFGIVGRTFRPVAVDEIQEAAADSLDRGDIEGFLGGRNVGRLRAERQCTLIGLLRIDHAKGHRRRTRPVRGDEIEAMGAGRFVDEIIDVALAIDRDLLGLVARDLRITHQPEQRVQLFGLRMRVFDKLEAVGAHRIVG